MLRSRASTSYERSFVVVVIAKVNMDMKSFFF